MAPEDVAREVDLLIAAERSRSLWFLRADYLPQTDAERRWALDQIQKRADRATFARAAELKRWLSPSSRDASVER